MKNILKISRWFFLLTGFVLLQFCTPEIRHPQLEIKKSDRWLDSTRTYAYIDSAWWGDFGDTQLDSIIARAFQNNHSLKAAVGRLEAAEAQATISGAELYPSLSVNAEGSRREQSLVTFPPEIRNRIENPVNTFGVSANISWELDLWGRVRNTKSAALATFEASQADYNGFLLSLSAQTIKAWFAAVEAERQLELFRSIMESHKLSEERVLERYEKGLRGSLDYRLSRSAVATAESNFYQRLQQMEGSKRQLELILGHYPDANIKVAAKLPEQFKAIPDSIPADILSRRPDIIAAERKLAAASCNITAAKAAMFPKISLTASAGTSTTEFSDILNNDFSIWSLGANILQPIFQGGKLRANVRLNEALQKQAFANYADIVLKAYSEIETVLSADQYLKQQEAALKIAAEEAQASEEIEEDRYYKGLSNIISLLDVRRQANNAKSRLLDIQRKRLENRVDFYIALGGAVN